MSELLDLDSQTIINAQFIDDWFFPCKQLLLTFQTDKQLTFQNDSSDYITYGTIEWVPYTYKESISGTTWIYDVICFPRYACKTPTQTIRTASALANEMDTTLTENSVNMSFDVPCKNLDLITLTNQYRWQSMERNYSSKKDATFIYFDTSGLLVTTLGNLTSQKAMTLEISESVPPTLEYWDSRLLHRYETVRGANPQTRTDQLKELVGRQVVLQSTTPANLFHMYTIGSENWHPELPAMLLTNCTIDSRRTPDMFRLCFTEVLI